jgi:hypothetical protein
MALGGNVKEVAEVAGVEPKTVRKYLSLDHHFQDEL